MQFLDRQGIITLSQEFSEKITLHFLIPSKEVIRYMSLNPNDEEIILAILRTYPGIYEMQTAFNLDLIAKKSNHAAAEIQAVLKKLKEKDIIEYHSKNNDATLIFNEVREDERTISRVSKYLENQNQLKKEQLKAVLDYINEKKVCKSKLILNYFGEKANTDCGICSYCITKKQRKPDVISLSKEIITLLQAEDLNSRDIQNKTKNSPDEVIFVLQHLLENNAILVKPNNKYTLRS
jgi:ATP-dependent DNA helicase RecQ